MKPTRKYSRRASHLHTYHITYPPTQQTESIPCPSISPSNRRPSRRTRKISPHQPCKPILRRRLHDQMPGRVRIEEPSEHILHGRIDLVVGFGRQPLEIGPVPHLAESVPLEHRVTLIRVAPCARTELRLGEHDGPVGGVLVVVYDCLQDSVLCVH